jgi:hypothetical protein
MMRSLSKGLRGDVVLLESILCWLALVNHLGLSAWKKTISGVLNDPTT